MQALDLLIGGKHPSRGVLERMSSQNQFLCSAPDVLALNRRGLRRWVFRDSFLTTHIGSVDAIGAERLFQSVLPMKLAFAFERRLDYVSTLPVSTSETAVNRIPPRVLQYEL